MNDVIRESKRRKEKKLFARLLRKRQTPQEVKLWEIIRNRRFEGLKFRRQFPIDPYIVDFACLQHRLIVEIDGGIHDLQREFDQEREEWLKAQGYSVVRCTNEEIDMDLSIVLKKIRHAITSLASKQQT